MSNILFCYPKTGFELGITSIEIPLSLVSIAAPLKENYKIDFVDCRLDKNYKNTLENHLKKRPLMILITCMTGKQILFALEISKMAKEHNIPVVWGGYHPTLFPKQVAAHKLIDIAVIGDGEETVVELADALKNNKSLENIKGLAFKKDGEVVVTEQRSHPDLEKIPSLPYDLFNAEKYVGGKLMASYHKDIKRVLPVISSRGCPHRCYFCAQPNFCKRRWNKISAEKTVELCDKLVKDYNLDAITFYDDNFLTDPKRAEKIAELINNRYKWGIQARMDDLDKSDLKKLERGGLNFIQPGIESGSNRILEFIKKDIDIDTILRVNKKLNKTDIVVVYNFMMGFPTETKKEVLTSIDLVSRLLKDNPKAYVAGFYTFTPYPGTELFKEALNHGFLPPTTLEDWADYSRHQNLTPWASLESKWFRNIFIASKFIDNKRISHFVDSKFQKQIIKIYSKVTKPLWNHHFFRFRPDLKILSKIIEKKNLL